MISKVIVFIEISSTVTIIAVVIIIVSQTIIVFEEINLINIVLNPKESFWYFVIKSHVRKLFVQ